MPSHTLPKDMTWILLNKLENDVAEWKHGRLALAAHIREKVSKLLTTAKAAGVEEERKRLLEYLNIRENHWAEDGVGTDVVYWGRLIKLLSHPEGTLETQESPG